jgi:hypothetical protein
MPVVKLIEQGEPLFDESCCKRSFFQIIVEALPATNSVVIYHTTQVIPVFRRKMDQQLFIAVLLEQTVPDRIFHEGLQHHDGKKYGARLQHRVHDDRVFEIVAKSQSLNLQKSLQQNDLILETDQIMEITFKDPAE